MKKIGKATAQEVRAIGANWHLPQTLGLPQNERWGRTYECFSETSEISSKLGATLIEGMQGDLSSQYAIATAKHYIGEGIAKNGINQGDIDGKLFEKELEELLIPYRKAIASGVKSVMVTYSSIDGVKCHENKNLITDILKGDLGFKGIVITDYNVQIKQVEVLNKEKIEKLSMQEWIC